MTDQDGQGLPGPLAQMFNTASTQEKFTQVTEAVARAIERSGDDVDRALLLVGEAHLLDPEDDLMRLRGVRLLGRLVTECPLTPFEHDHLLGLLMPTFTDPCPAISEAAFHILFLTGLRGHLATRSYTCATAFLDHETPIYQARALDALKGVAVDVDFGPTLLDRVSPYLEDAHPTLVRLATIDLIKMVGEHDDFSLSVQNRLLPLTRSPNAHVAQAATIACAELLSLTDSACSGGLPPSSLRVAWP